MIDYVSESINNIVTQISGQNHIWLLYGEEGIGKSSIANTFSITHKNVLSYNCNNEFDLACYVSNNITTGNYNRYINLYQPLIKIIKSNKICTIIFDIEGIANIDYFDLIFNFFESMNQQNLKLNIILFVDSKIYHNNQNIFAKYPQLVYLEPLKKWDKIDFFQLWKEIYNNSEVNYEVLELIASFSMGNAGVFLQHLNILKYYGILIFENGKWNFVNTDNIKDLLTESFSEIVRKKYELLESELQTVIQQTSTIGYVFKRNDLKEVFNVENSITVLKRIEIITELLYFTDSKMENGKFDSKKVQKQIEKMVDPIDHRNWCLALAKYYETKANKSNPVSIERYRFKEKCAFYFIQASENSKAIFHYVSLVPLLCKLNLYNSALEITHKLRNLTEQKEEFNHFYIYSFYLLTQINRSLGNYVEAMINLNQYTQLSNLDKLNYELSYLNAELLYGVGDIPKSYKILRLLYKNSSSIDDPNLKLNIISMLSSIEETVNNNQYIKHYNEALSIAKKNLIIDDYYKLLRKANIAHLGENGIILMQTAKEYFYERNNIIELIMVQHNIGTESLFYENTYNQAFSELEYAYKNACEYGFNQLTYIINSLSIFNILEGQYETAIETINPLLEIHQEDFTKLALYLNKSTCLRKMGKLFESTDSLILAKKLNQKEQNKIPFFEAQILLQEAYIYWDSKKYSQAYNKFCEYFKCDFLDRNLNIISVKKSLKDLCNKHKFPYPKSIENFSDTCDEISNRISNNHLVLCDLMFWE